MPQMPTIAYVFHTRLGWMGVVAAGTTVRQLTFGHSTQAAARAALAPGLVIGAMCGGADARIPRRLQAYAKGTPDDFLDLRVDPGPVSDFRRRVLDECRRIAYGTTMSYGELAARAGYARAARAVGRSMALNRIPLIIPCHRVVCSDGRLGAYSACGGVATKRRLLEMESGNFLKLA